MVTVPDSYYRASIFLARAVEDIYVTPIGITLPQPIVDAYLALKKEYHVQE